MAGEAAAARARRAHASSLGCFSVSFARRAIDASLINHTRWGQLPDDVIELVLDIKQEERVQHELVKPASSLCCMPCDVPCGMAPYVVASWEYALSAYMNQVN